MRSDRKGIKQVIALIVAGLLLCGCAGQETSKTIVLPKETEDAENNAGIDVRDIKEYSFEGSVYAMTWKRDSREEICVLRDQGEGLGYQTVNIYQGTESEIVVFEERPVSVSQIAPGGQCVLYETFDNDMIQLILYRVQTGEKLVIHERDGSMETCCFSWSGDGTRFFVWPDGDYSGQNTVHMYPICRYDALSGEKTEIMLEGTENARRQAVPNEDGSKVYVQEEYPDEEGNMSIFSEEWMDLYRIENTELETDAGYIDGYEPQLPGRSWVVDMDTSEVTELDAEKLGITYPIKYMKQGLVGRIGEVVWYLAEPLADTEKKRILTTGCKDIRICGEGDHIFLIDWESGTGTLQVTGIQMQDGEVAGRQVLYKGIHGLYVEADVGQDDSELFIQTLDFTKNGGDMTRVTVLEY